MQAATPSPAPETKSSPTSQLFYDPKSNLLVYDTPLRDKLAENIPNAKLLNGYVAFPKTLFACQMAAWFGLPPPPVLDDYNWPIIHGRQPLRHQMLTANFMCLHPKCFNLSDMGTMKTL